MNTDTVKHEGVISRVDEKYVEVKIQSSSACAACHVKAACGMGESKEKTIIVPRPKDKSFEQGQRVTVTMSVSQGNKAAFIAYFFPFVVLVVTLLVLLHFGVKDVYAALISIASLIPCYLAIYAFRGKIDKKFFYEVE